MSEFEITKKVTNTVLNRMTQEAPKTKSLSEDRIRQIVMEEVGNLQALMQVPEFDDLLKWAITHLKDADCLSFVNKAAPLPILHELFPDDTRRGGGWIGVVKSTLTIERKMQKERLLNV